MDCPSDALSAAADAARADPASGLQAVETLLQTYAQDARLWFLKGSLLAGLGRYDEARSALASAVGQNPAFDLARFQLGFLELTCGEGEAAVATLDPLTRLDGQAAIGCFARGLCSLIVDDFAAATAALEDGIRLNTDNPLLNRDMQLLIDGMSAQPATPAEPEMLSSTQLILQQFGKKPTRH